MSKFLTSDELSYNYAVTSERLLAYAARGNLAMSRRDGVMRFDEAGVARLFPRRHEAPASAIGTLGHVRLGLPASAD